MTGSWVQFLPAIVGGIVAVVAFFGGWLLVRGKLGLLFDWLAQKTRIKKIAELDEMLVGFAMDVYQAEVKELKAASADGKLSKEDAQRMMKILIDKAKNHFGVEFFKGFVANAGYEAVESFIKARAETAIIEAKGRGAEVKATAASAKVVSGEGPKA